MVADKGNQRHFRSSCGFIGFFDAGIIDFERITFNTLDTPQVIAFNKKVKKFIVLQIIFKNDTLDEGFGIYGVQVQYVVGGYVK